MQGPPPRRIGGPPPRPAPRGPLEASSVVWRRGRQGPDQPPLVPRSRGFGRDPALTCSALRWPGPCSAPGPGKNCHRSETPAREGSLLPWLVPYFFLTRSENPAPPSTRVCPKRGTEELGGEAGGVLFRGFTELEAGS